MFRIYSFTYYLLVRRLYNKRNKSQQKQLNPTFLVSMHTLYTRSFISFGEIRSFLYSVCNSRFQHSTITLTHARHNLFFEMPHDGAICKTDIACQSASSMTSYMVNIEGADFSRARKIFQCHGKNPKHKYSYSLIYLVPPMHNCQMLLHCFYSLKHRRIATTLFTLFA